ncbi:unnamed protein product [Prorocentrum cordatum]|nr:unnamed protein product [Polarella glacialis]
MTKQQDCRHARRRRCPASVDGILPRRPQGVRADAQVPPSLKKVMASTQPAVQWHHVASWVGVAKAGHAVWARGGPKGRQGGVALARARLIVHAPGARARIPGGTCRPARAPPPCLLAEVRRVTGCKVRPPADRNEQVPKGACRVGGAVAPSTACDWSPCASASGFSSHGPWRQVRSSAVRARGSPAHGGHGVSQRMPQNLTASPRNLSKSSPRGGGAGPGRGSRARGRRKAIQRAAEAPLAFTKNPLSQSRTVRRRKLQGRSPYICASPATPATTARQNLQLRRLRSERS